VFLPRQRAANAFAVPDSGAITTAFQPIVSLGTGEVLGVEALSRFDPAGREAPENWFSDAARAGRTVELEVRAAVAALDAAAALPVPGYVAVNFSPATLLWSGFARLLSSSPIDPARIVLELTEHTAVADYALLGRALRPLRKAGIRLSVDDAGAGYATFRHIVCLSPEIIKIDRTLISGMDADPALRAFAAAVVAFAREMRSIVIAEGIERPAELAVLRRLAVDAGQGYLLGRPTSRSDDWLAWRRPLQLPDPSDAPAPTGRSWRRPG
jgi:EAL domain-containing protein (putative c-di-GMP-specific phosphodiesterase class I)